VWATTGLLLGWAACVLLLVYFLEVRPRLRADAPSVDTVPTVQAGFPAPPRGAVVYARQLGRNALALGLVPEAGQLIAQASVVGPEGDGLSGLDISFAARGSVARARSCGPGCYRAALSADAAPRTMEVTVDGDESTRWVVSLPAEWPPRSAAATVARANTVWRTLRSLSFEETLGSGLPHVLRSSWQVEAPNRLAYRIVGGAEAVVVGSQRWDRNPGEPWKESRQQEIRQPVPPWVGATNAYVVGATTVGGRPATVVTFFDPNTPGWYRLVVERDSGRTTDVRMIATSHFMRDRLYSFDATPRIRPPR
jgi:hypothetical protein